MAAPKNPQEVPSESEVLRLLKQDAKRKQYMKSPKAKANRQAYQAKRKVEAQAAREFVKNNPEMLEKMIAENPELAVLRPKS